MVHSHLQDFLKTFGITLDTVKVLIFPRDERMRALISLRAFGLVSQIILDTLNGLKMTYPELSAGRRQELQSIRERLTNGDLD